MPFFFFPLPKVPCDATATCNSHGSCTNDGDCECDDNFFAANCSGKISLKYRTIISVPETQPMFVSSVTIKRM